MARNRDLRLDVIVQALDRGLGAVAAQIELVAQRLEALDRQVARPRVEVDTDDAERNIGRFAADMERRIGRAVRSLPKIEVTSDTDRLTRQLQTLREQLVALSRQRIGIDVDADTAFANIQRIKAELERLTRARGATVRVRTDAAAALAELEAVRAAAARADRTEVDIRVRGHKSIRDMVNGIAQLTRSLRVLGLPLAFLGALPTLISMAGAVGELTGAFGLLPGALLGVGAAIGAVVIGFQGLGDALGPTRTKGQLEKVQRALESISPAARSVVAELRALAPAWHSVQTTVQENLFAGVGEQIKQLGGTFIPVLRAGLGGVAGALNDGVRLWAEWAAGAETVRDTGRIFEGIRAGIDNLAPGMRDLAAALTDIAVVSAGMFPRLAAGISEALGRFRDFIAQARDTGQLEAWIQRGIEAFASLGRSIVNIGSAFAGLSNAADQALGGTFLSRLETATQRFDEFVNSVEGQQRIVAFFDSIQGAVDSILPGLQSLGSAIADAFIVAGPSAETFGTALSSIVTSLAPALSHIAALTSVVALLASGFAGLISALGPLPALLLGVVVAFRLLGTVGALLGGMFTAVAAGLGAVATAATAAGARMAVTAGAMRLVSTAATGLGVAALSTARFLAGPWGAALLVAGSALAFFADSGAREAEAKLAAVRAQAEALQSTLNQLTGGITDATVAQQAHNLAMDGTISRAAEFGITADVATQASLDNARAMQSVNDTLVEHATRLIEADAQYQQLTPLLDAAGISAEDLAAALVEGGAGADAMIDRLQSLHPELSREDQQLTALGQSLVGATEGHRALAESLGVSQAELARVIDAQIQAAAGAVNYEASLLQARGAIQQFGAALDQSTGSIIQTADGAQQLSTALQRVTNDATTTALAAGIAAQAQGTLADGVRAAGASMEASRAAFIAAAEAAGLGAEEAKRLADAMLLIPEVAQVAFELRGATVAQQQIGEILAAMQALPDQKTFVVDALTEEAQARLQALGFEVQQLADGTWQITVTDNAADVKGRLDALLAAGLSLSEAIKIIVTLDGAAEVEAMLDALEGKIKSFPPMPPIRPILDLDTGPFDGKLGDAQGRAGEPLPIPQMDVDPSPGIRQISNVQQSAATPLPEPSFVVNVVTALANIALVVAAAVALALLPSPTLDVNTDAAQAAITALQAAITALAPLVPIPINLDTLAATTALTALTTAINAIRIQPPIPLVLDTLAAMAAITALRTAILALNTLTTTARHTQTHNIPEVIAAILTLNSQATTAPHVQTHNVPQVISDILVLNSQHTTSTHTVSHNVPAVRSAIQSLNGLDTRSTHTITTVHRSVNVLASGGAVLGRSLHRASGGMVARMAGGGILPGYRPGQDTIPAMLSPGESVLTPEATRLLGARTIMGLNRMASGRKGVVVGRGALPGSRGGRIGGGLVGGIAGGGISSRQFGQLITAIHEQTTMLRTRDGVTINVPGGPGGNPQENAQATKLALRTMA